MLKEIFVFNGVHGSGKSTVAQELGKDPRFAYFYEVGGKLRAESSNHSMTSEDAFDQLVLATEIERDKELLASDKIPLVETWHPGNMAFIKTRLPSFYPEYQRQFEQQLKFFKPHGVILEIGWDTFRKRSTEKLTPNELEQSVGFYQNVLANLYGIYQHYDIPYTTISNETPLAQTLEQVRKIVK